MSPATATKPHPAAAYHERRRREVDDRLLATAREVLAEVGLDAFTVEEVARRAGIAKTTIYRRVDNAGQLAARAIAGPKASDGAIAQLLETVGREMAAAARVWHASYTQNGFIAPEVSLDVFARVALAVALEPETGGAA